MAIPQAAVIVMLDALGKPIHAACVGGVLFAQVILMGRLLRQPRERAPWYNGTGTTLYVAGMMITAFALRP
jgi:chlorophyll synthase